MNPAFVHGITDAALARLQDQPWPGNVRQLEMLLRVAASLLGRGPLGNAVLELYPESLCPHLCELVLGFEPWFEIALLRSDAADFARTVRAWLLGLREHEAAARTLVGADMTGRFRRYLISSEMQFRTGAITNYRVVLHRRPKLRW